MTRLTLHFLMIAFVGLSVQRSASNFNQDILGTWVFEKVEFVFDANINQEEREFIDVFMIPMLEEGLSYVQMTFYADGTAKTIVDAPDESLEDYGSWYLSPDGKVLTMQFEDGTDSHDVHLLNASTMVLAVEDEGFKLLIHLKKR
jgi:hypothetical protein